MKIWQLICFIFLFASAINAVFCQSKKVIQVSGIVYSAKDNHTSVPFATIAIKNRNEGALASFEGVYTIVCYEGDTLVCSSVSFKNQIFVVPPVEGDRLQKMFHLKPHVELLPEVVIRPYPTPDEFPYTFVNKEIPDDMLEVARKNLEQAHMRELAERVKPDGRGSASYAFREVGYRSYYRGQVPPMNIFNPFAWAQFFKAWKRGDFKRKDDD